MSGIRAFSTLLLAVCLAGRAFAAEPDGAALYATHCASCHGPDGRAETPVARALGVKSLLIPRWASEDAVEAIARAIREGVPGMPGMTKQLSPAEIEAVSRATREMAAAATAE